MYDKLKPIFTIMTVVLVYFLISYQMLSKETKGTHLLQYPDEIGLNEELKEQIDLLEQDISRRMSYEVVLSRDPLNLNSVVQLPQQRQRRETAQSDNALRLSCTMISQEKKSAVIRYRDKSHIVSIGDHIAGQEVVDIDTRTVVISHGGTETVLRNRPAPTLEEYGRSE